MRVVNQKYKVITMNYRVDKVNKVTTTMFFNNKFHLRKLKQNNQ